MRKQYHFRPGPDGTLDAWDVDRLLALVAEQPVEELPLDAIAELETAYWFGHGSEPSVRAVAEHFRLMSEADTTYPIIIDPHGGVMDGMHRVARLLADGRTTVSARRLTAMPEPDYRGVHPDDLPY